jgi:bacillithiol system protein YtxJ
MEFWRVQAIQQRPLSQQIAQRTGVAHESPQVLLFQNGQVVWQASQGRIHEEAMREGLQLLQQGLAKNRRAEA